MTGTVVSFPSQIERTIKNLLDKTSANEDIKKELSDRLLNIWEKHSHRVDMSISIPFPKTLSDKEKNDIVQIIKIHEKKLQEFVHILIYELFKVETELFCYEKGML